MTIPEDQPIVNTDMLYFTCSGGLSSLTAVLQTAGNGQNNPVKNLDTSAHVKLGETPNRTEPRVKLSIEIESVGFLPYLSINDPHSGDPKALPAINEAARKPAKYPVLLRSVTSPKSMIIMELKG
jgi:hypothetical protein